MTKLQTVKIHEQEISVKEYNGQRVVTFNEIDAVHSRPTGTARKAYNRNKTRFVQDKDFFVLKTDEAKNSYGITAPNGITLLTQTGYLMLVKVFDDKLAWNIQRELVNTYFNKPSIRKTGAYTLKKPAPETGEQLKLAPEKKTRKTWKGVQVVTLRDIFEATGTTTGILSWRLRHGTQYVNGEDYFLLQGAEFGAYKKENKLYNYGTRGLIVVTGSGLKKLHDAIGWEIAPKPTALPAPPPKKDESTLRADIPNNPQIQEAIAQARRKIIALESVVEGYNRYFKEDEASGYQKVLRSLAIDAQLAVADLAGTKFQLTSMGF